ncbi:DJ-1/PfpI family protein [Candidatus Uabimicrobium amorphum]|uniref:Thiazole biosynthesis protein ThiJ n=1 Tax=Uabimicrobium amorphum TaxID=2596890 RepID=A0A5S9IS24_UABAM|nr:DJ-1/PfpI family protein [Candidatus Uabimicrobium amorphum]BBM86500.1 thiazole biosynthesis protein ThiJ [Candidatus Uabimicrobium amorphum]
MRNLLILILSILCIYAEKEEQLKKIPKSVLMCVPHGFQPVEYFQPRKYFDEKKYHVEVAAKFDIPLAPDQRYIDQYPMVIPDVIFSKVDVNKYDVIIFVGGNGAWEDFFPNGDVHKIVTTAIKKNKKLALICAAAGLLAFVNNLDGKGVPVAKGRNITGYKKVAGALEFMGQVKYSTGDLSKPHVVVDGNFITARDQSSALLFAKTISAEMAK